MLDIHQHRLGLLPSFWLLPTLSLKMVAAYAFQMSVNLYWTVWHYILEHSKKKKVKLSLCLTY
jgi:hypothetical protein